MRIDKGLGQPGRPRDCGQTSVLMAGVLAIVVVLVAGVSMIGQAMVGRARARTGADAVALAHTSDPLIGVEVAEWYRRQGVDVVAIDNRADASGGPSQASAWASVDGNVTAAPVLVAIVARIEQLTGSAITPVNWEHDSVTVHAADAAVIATAAADFGLCDVGPSDAATAGGVIYRLC